MNEVLELPLHAQMNGDRGGRAPLDERKQQQRHGVRMGGGKEPRATEAER